MNIELLPQDIFLGTQEIERTIKYGESFSKILAHFNLLEIEKGYVFDIYKSYSSRDSWKSGYGEKRPFTYIENNPKHLAPPAPRNPFKYISWRWKIYKKQLYLEYADGMYITDLIKTNVPDYLYYTNHIITEFTPQGLWQCVVFNMNVNSDYDGKILQKYEDITPETIDLYGGANGGISHRWNHSVQDYDGKLKREGDLRPVILWGHDNATVIFYNWHDRKGVFKNIYCFKKIGKKIVLKDIVREKLCNVSSVSFSMG